MSPAIPAPTTAAVGRCDVEGEFPIGTDSPGGALLDARLRRASTLDLESGPMSEPGGIVAAGHPRSAEVGAGVLRAGGNAVDAAIATVLASWVCEPLLTGPARAGTCSWREPASSPHCSISSSRRPGAGHEGEHVPLQPYEVDFGDTTQVFNCGVASCGVPGSPAGLAAAASAGERFRSPTSRRPRRRWRARACR